MKAKKAVCQSCASPILRDFDKGNERDGTPSEFYCRRCYALGAFTEPKMTAEEMHEIVRNRVMRLNFPRFLARLSADSVYTLRRWAPIAGLV